MFLRNLILFFGLLIASLALAPQQALAQNGPIIVKGAAKQGDNNSTLTVGTAHIWSYMGQAGEALILTTVADWNTALALFDSTSNLDFNDDAEGLPNYNSQIIFTLPASGEYFIGVFGYEHSVGGVYTLRIESSNETLSAAPQITRNADWTPVEQDFNGIPFVQVPAGCFMMGYDGEGGQQCVGEPFWISKTEVTQADFARLGGTKANANAYSGDDNPVDSITWFEAQAFCEGLGGRLPTEAEWEYAARGPESMVYPWGKNYDATRVIGYDDPIYGSKSTAPVGSRPAGASWVGALDMAGNVQEWTLSEYRDYPYVADDGRNIMQDSSTRRVLRGGSFDYSHNFLRAANRLSYLYPDYTYSAIGFRCVTGAATITASAAPPVTTE